MVPKSREKGEHGPITEAEKVPMNHITLRIYVGVGGKAEFRRVEPWGDNKDDADSEDGKVNSKVDFTMCFSTDKDPEKLLNQIKGEFQKLGGLLLQLKNLNVFDPKPTTVLYRVLNKNNLVTSDNEFQDII